MIVQVGLMLLLLSKQVKYTLRSLTKMALLFAFGVSLSTYSGGHCVWNSTIFSMCLLFAAFKPRLGLDTWLQVASVFGSVSNISDVNQLSDIIVEPEFLAWEHFCFFYCGGQISAEVNIKQTVCRLQWLQRPTKKTKLQSIQHFYRCFCPKQLLVRDTMKPLCNWDQCE